MYAHEQYNEENNAKIYLNRNDAITIPEMVRSYVSDEIKMQTAIIWASILNKNTI